MCMFYDNLYTPIVDVSDCVDLVEDRVFGITLMEISVC